MYEDIDTPRAIKTLRASAKNGGAPWYLTLAAKLEAKIAGKENDEIFALNYLLDMKEQYQTEEMSVLLDARIKEIQDRLAKKIPTKKTAK